MTGMGELAALVNTRRKIVPGGRLILRVAPADYQALTAAALDAGQGASLIPAVPVAEGTGLSNRQTEVEVVEAMTGWQLVDDGEIVGEGQL